MSDELKCFQHQQPVRRGAAEVRWRLTHSQDFTNGHRLCGCWQWKNRKHPIWFPSTLQHLLGHIFGVLAAAFTVERANLSAGVGICRESESLHMQTAQRPPAHCASDEWGTRPLIYLNLQLHSWLEWSLSPADEEIQCRTAPRSPGVESLDQHRG